MCAATGKTRSSTGAADCDKGCRKGQRVIFLGAWTMRIHLMAMVVTVSSAALVSSGASAMSLSFSWAGVPHCSHHSPAFALSGVPAGTSRLAFRLVDLDFRPFPHGGGTIAYQGGRVAAGAFSYIGPCPPPGHRHTYRWTVQALDAGGRPLASASTARPYPP